MSQTLREKLNFISVFVLFIAFVYMLIAVNGIFFKIMAIIGIIRFGDKLFNQIFKLEKN